MAVPISSRAGTVGAILIFLSRGSTPYGNVAPAGVNFTPASDASLSASLAQLSGASRLIK